MATAVYPATSLRNAQLHRLWLIAANKATSDGKVFPDNKHSVSFVVKAGVICCTATPLNNLSVYLHNQGNCEGGICPTIYPPYVCAGKERVYVLRRVVVQCAVSVYGQNVT